MNYFHEYLDEFFAGLLRGEVSRLSCWGDSDFSDGVVERLPGYGTSIKASSLVKTDLPDVSAFAPPAQRGYLNQSR